MGEERMEKRFRYKSLEDLVFEASTFGISFPLSENTRVFAQSLVVSGKTIPNRFVVQPMEGTDANPDGSPGPLTWRRYRRFALGGAGIIWFEATAVSETARANEKQLFLSAHTLDSFKKLVMEVKETCLKENGYVPYLVVQLTHSGRFGKHKKIIFHDEYLDGVATIGKDHPVMTDEELDALKYDFLKAAILSKEAGFDAVDIKACHRYLLSESLAAHTREGKYGGTYENRTRLLKDIVSLVRKEVDIDVVVRLNVSDFIPYPYGWGTDKQGMLDFREPRRLLLELKELGVKMVNVTAATPYLLPHVNRPYDQMGRHNPPEHPIVGTARLIQLSKLVKEVVGDDVLVVGSGLSWLRQFSAFVGAGMLRERYCDLVGYGRMAFAYPDFARDILDKGFLDANKVCITCSKCAELKAFNENCGCVVRDQEIYLPIYKRMEERIK